MARHRPVPRPGAPYKRPGTRDHLSGLQFCGERGVKEGVTDSTSSTSLSALPSLGTRVDGVSKDLPEY